MTSHNLSNTCMNTNLPNGFGPQTLAGGNIILKGALANSYSGSRSTSSPSPTVNLDHLSAGKVEVWYEFHSLLRKRFGKLKKFI